MITELSGILLTALGLSTTGTVVGFLMQRRHNKRMSALQEQITTLEVEKATIETKSKTWHLYEEQLDKANQRIVELLEINAKKETRNQELADRYNERIREIEDRFNKQTEVLRSTNSKLNKALERISQLLYEKGKLKLVIQYLDHWKCFRVFGASKDDCKRREPEQEVKKFKHIPLNEDLQMVLDNIKKESDDAVKEETDNG